MQIFIEKEKIFESFRLWNEFFSFPEEERKRKISDKKYENMISDPGVLKIAAGSGHPDIFKYFIDQDILLSDPQYKNILCFAAYGGNIDI